MAAPLVPLNPALSRSTIKEVRKTAIKPQHSWRCGLTNNRQNGHSGATLTSATGNVMQQLLALRLLLPAAMLHGDVVSAG